MSESNQIFQTKSKTRWNTYKWGSRFFIFLLLLMIPIVWLALAGSSKTILPGLSKDTYTKLDGPAEIPKNLTVKEAKKFKGYDAYLKAKDSNTANMLFDIKRKQRILSNNHIRAAFYVDWDPQSYNALETYIDRFNTVIPEWFFIDRDSLKLITQIDTAALHIMQKKHIRILPMLNNVDFKERNGNFSGKILSKVLNNPTKRNQFINDIISTIEKYHFQGVNIDFEDIEEKSINAMNIFQKELYIRMHNKGLLVTQTIMPDNEDFDIKVLNESNDYLFLMAYDQHYSTSVPGPISDQRWIEKELDKIAAQMPTEKIVLCIAGYGYDWAANSAAETVTYQQALATAKQFKATIDFDNDTYNCYYQYNDFNGVHHDVYFLDAAGNFNTIRFADEYGTAGVALWRLGAEDERLWKFYSHDLTYEGLLKDTFNFQSLSKMDVTEEKPDYIGTGGEVLDVLSDPSKGIIDIYVDSAEQIISEEVYKVLPTRYEIRRFGQVRNQVILTFDDGPDEKYTSEILDILNKEKIPATFFIVGINAEANLPLLKRIYNEGYEIGNHTFTHPNMAEVSQRRAQTEMDATRLLLESTTGRSTILFRAPFNADAEPTKAVELKPIARAKLNNYYTVGEAIDPEDWDIEHGVNADSIFNRIKNQYEKFYNEINIDAINGDTIRPNEKGIILLHDAGGNRSATVEALPRIIKYFKNRGTKFISVAELLHLKKDEVMPPVKGGFIEANSIVSQIWYWVGRFFSAAFWVAIFLGLAKIFLMAALATIQYFRSKKEEKLLINIPPGKVSIIVPAYNEEINAVRTIQNLLQQDYADFEIIFVDDGSKDTTYQKVLDYFKNESKVKIFSKPNGGKASALNFGIAQSQENYVVCIDADTQLKTDAVAQLMKYFTLNQNAQLKKPIVAVAGNVKVGNEKNIITKWQSIEYITAQNFDRRAFDLINGITVVPGAIGAFYKPAIIEAGGFTTDTLAEDCDLTIRLLRNGGAIRNANKAIAITEAPETLNQFMKQRFRWSYGIMQSFWKNKEAAFNPKYKSLGMVSLPNIFIYQMILSAIAPLADAFFIFSIFWNHKDKESLKLLIVYYTLFLIINILVSILAFIFEKEKMSKLIWLIPQSFVYRQLMYIIFFKSIRKALKGEVQGWGVLKRTGNAQMNSSNKQPISS